jgi:nicotinamidase-related amidase
MTIDSPQTFPGWFMPWPAFEVNWNRAGLLVIDFQNYSSNPECGVARMLREQHPSVAEYYLPRLDLALRNTQRLLESFRNAKKQVIFTRHGALLADGRDMIARRRVRDQASLDSTNTPTLWSKGSFEHEIVAALAPQPDELIVDKNASSAFNGSAIDQFLRNMDLETLIIAGMATDMCVETTARDAADRGYQVIVVEDATATFFAEHHDAALSSLARVYTRVMNHQDVIDLVKP